MTGATALPRTGIGVDVHAYADQGSDRVLMLGCLEWPGERGIEGHSDDDVDDLDLGSLAAGDDTLDGLRHGPSSVRGWLSDHTVCRATDSPSGGPSRDDRPTLTAS